MPDYRHILWEGRRWLITAVLLFVCGLVAGLIVSLTVPDEALRILQPAMERLRATLAAWLGAHGHACAPRGGRPGAGVRRVDGTLVR